MGPLGGRRPSRRAALWLALPLLWAAGGRGAAIDFDHEIVPILRQRCAECHTGSRKKGGLSFNTRASLLAGGESGPVIKSGNSSDSLLIEVVTSADADHQMPPKGDRLTAAEVGRLRDWINAGAPWTDGFAFQKAAYEPPLKPRHPILPPAHGGRTNPIDRLLDAHLAEHHTPRPGEIDDGVFLRRVSLDLVGLLPEPLALNEFLRDRSSGKRGRMIRALLTNDVAYAEHWLSFWNDLLRNDYSGTGYIDDGRKQISAWLYQALLDNRPYDQFARELISPTPESEGFARGIRWRGVVSAGQTVPVQFAQSVGQTFLGVNLKCASCHDSFIDHWTLEDAYGLAAVYSDQPLELYRCDKATGRRAKAAWLFPELGRIDADRPAKERLVQLAQLMTSPDNGRFTRTIVNRLWHRLMGRGIVHPTDAMQTEPWNADLLDFLASDLADHHYDLKRTLALICDSAAYQSRTQPLVRGQDDHGYTYAGPRARRMTAEQFVDAVWQLTGSAPEKYDAPVVRGRADPLVEAGGRWIWAVANPAPAGQVATFRKSWVLAEKPATAGAAITADNSYVLYVNGRKLRSDDHWESVELVSLESALQAGTNEIVITAANGGDSPNPAGIYFEARWPNPAGGWNRLASDETWAWTPHKAGEGGGTPSDAVWRPAVVVPDDPWRSTVSRDLRMALSQVEHRGRPMVRAALLNSDRLMRTLGRPNREQIVSMRPNDLATLEAMDLSNGSLLADRLHEGARRLASRSGSTEDKIRWVYAAALSRPPASGEFSVAREALGELPSIDALQDFLWAICMLPEFQLVR